jgi:hypothetical protein
MAISIGDRVRATDRVVVVVVVVVLSARSPLTSSHATSHSTRRRMPGSADSEGWLARIAWLGYVLGCGRRKQRTSDLVFARIKEKRGYERRDAVSLNPSRVFQSW